MKPQHAISLLLALIILAAAGSSIYAQDTSVTVVVLRAANLRSGPGISFDIVGSAKAGESLLLVGCDSQCSWYKTDKNVWIAGFLLTNPPSDLPVVSAGTLTATPIPSPSQGVAAAAGGAAAKSQANLRSGPGTSFAIIGSVPAGKHLDVVAVSAAGDWFRLASGEWIAVFLVDGAPSTLPTDNTVTPSEPAATSTPNAPSQVAAGDSGLTVQFINPHYDCTQGVQNSSSDGPIWGYRRFQIDMYIANNGNEPVEPPWEPTRWTITDGVTDSISDWNWQWLRPGSYTFYEQPTIQPGGVEGWTFVAFPIDRNQWVKAVDFVYKGHVFHQEFDLGPFRNAANYKDCGEPRSHEFKPTATPDPRNLP